MNLFKSVDILKEVWHNDNVNGTNERKKGHKNENVCINSSWLWRDCQF